jgi:hypothetical protein
MTTTSDDKKYIKKNQRLPESINAEFELITDNLRRDRLIKELVNANWTYEAISNASGLTRERIRQISNAADKIPKEGIILNVDIPEPPVIQEKKPKEYVEPSPEILKRLLELQPYAQQVRANGTKYRAEAEEYTELLNHARTVEGVTLYRLAKRLGITHGAIRFRLARYGYIQPKSAKSKVYQPILKDNRLIKDV